MFLNRQCVVVGVDDDGDGEPVKGAVDVGDTQLVVVLKTPHFCGSYIGFFRIIFYLVQVENAHQHPKSLAKSFLK